MDNEEKDGFDSESNDNKTQSPRPGGSGRRIKKSEHAHYASAVTNDSDENKNAAHIDSAPLLHNDEKIENEISKETTAIADEIISDEAAASSDERTTKETTATTDGEKTDEHIIPAVANEKPIIDTVPCKANDDYDPFDLPPGDHTVHKNKAVKDIDPFDLPPGDYTVPQNKTAENVDPFDLPPGDYTAPPDYSAHTAPPVSHNAYGQPITEEMRKKTEKNAALLYLIGIAVSFAIGFIFMCTPFMYLTARNSGGEFSVVQHGLGVIACMFTGESELALFGVPQSLVREAGYMYIVYFFCYLLALVNAIITFRHRDRAGSKMIFFAILMAMLGITFSVWTPVACEEVYAIRKGDAALSSYSGMVGMGLSAIVGGIIVVIAYLMFHSVAQFGGKKYSNKAFTAVVVAAMIALLGLQAVPLFVETEERVNTVRAGEYGYGKVFLDEQYGEGYYGVTLFKTEGLEEGKTYRFAIRTEEEIEAVYMKETVGLLYYASAVGKSPLEIVTGSHVLAFNQDCGKSTAVLTFEYTGGELAVGIMFGAIIDLYAENICYSFEQV